MLNHSPTLARFPLNFPCPCSRRLDLFLGLACALSLHGWLFLADDRAPVRPVVRVEEEKVVQMEMPPLDPEKPDTVEELREESAAQQMAPPTLLDVPTVVPVDAFTQPLSPPPPPGIEIGKNVLAIPVGKPGGSFGKGIQNLFSIDNLDQRPVLKAPIPPDYPFEMRKQGVTGAVTVEFIIDTEGNVVATQVVGSTNPAFEFPAVRAVQKWKFRPGRKGGRAVNTRVQQVITFNLDAS